MVGQYFGHAIASDSQSNIYVGSGVYTALTKFDGNGNVIWSFRSTNGGLDVLAIVIDGSNAVYVCGTVGGGIRAGAITNLTGDSSMFFAKFTTAGSNTLGKIFRNLHANYGTKPFARTSDGSFLVGGWFSNPVTYEGITVSPSSDDDALLFKIATNGAPVWYRRGTGNLYDWADTVASTANGEVTLAGTCTSSSFGIAGVTVSNSASKSLYLVKMDASGSGIWGKSVPSSYNPAGELTISSAVAYSPTSDSVIWGGDFSGSLPLVSPPISSTGGKDAFVTKISATGGVAWARALGGAGDQFINAATVDSFGNIYVGGFFSNQIKIGSITLTSFGGRDLFVAKYRDDGTFVWVKQIGWTAGDDEMAMAFSPAGELLVTGTVRGGVSIDGTYIEGTNSSDAFIAKFYSEAVPPRFITDPQSQIVSAGMTFSLSATLTVNDPGVYLQWWFNGAPLMGKTNLTLTITNAQPANAGSYYLVATNDGGVAQTSPALISYTDASTLTLSIHPSLTIFGTTGRTYRIEYATQIQGPANWTTATNLTLTSSPQVWVDPTAAIGEKRIYRTVLLP
jgi:hypothetical protein